MRNYCKSFANSHYSQHNFRFEFYLTNDLHSTEDILKKTI